MDRMTDTERKRFADYIAVNGDCWAWKGVTDQDGYGIFYFRRLSRRAHRVSYWASVGDIPPRYVVDHICGQPACVRPEHLRCLSASENSLLGGSPAALNARKTACPNGHPYDRQYPRQRACSICEKAKGRRLKKKWRAENTTKC